MELSQQEDVNLHWLLTGEGPKYYTKHDPNKAHPDTPIGELIRQSNLDFSLTRRIPVLGKVPAGPPGGESWVDYDAPDMLEELVATDDPFLIALEVHGSSMFPTLFEGDKVVMSPESTYSRGDIVVVEIEENSGDYQVKRLGQHTKSYTGILSDNFLHFEPQRYPSEVVHIRGKVIKVVRTPKRQVVGGDEALLHFYQSPVMHEVIDLLPQLSETALDLFIDHLKKMVKAGM